MSNSFSSEEEDPSSDDIHSLYFCTGVRFNILTYLFLYRLPYFCNTGCITLINNGVAPAVATTAIASVVVPDL